MTKEYQYKSLNSFKKKIEKGTNWHDYMVIGGKLYKLYEYGDTDGKNYCYWVNKGTHNAIYITYSLPSISWEKIPEVCEYTEKEHEYKKGTLKIGWLKTCKKCKRTEREKITKGYYKLYSFEFIENMDLWRTDTL